MSKQEICGMCGVWMIDNNPIPEPENPPDEYELGYCIDCGNAERITEMRVTRDMALDAQMPIEGDIYYV